MESDLAQRAGRRERDLRLRGRIQPGPAAGQVRRHSLGAARGASPARSRGRPRSSRSAGRPPTSCPSPLSKSPFHPGFLGLRRSVVAFTRWFPVLPCLMSLPSMALAASLAAPPHPPIQAIHTTGVMRCDGVLDEPVWAQAQPATQLYQQTPNQGQPASMKSEFRVLYDEAALYIGARLYDAHPESIQANLGRRD